MSINWNEADYSGYEWVLDKPEEQFDIEEGFNNDRLILCGPSNKLGLSAYQEKKVRDGWVKILPTLERVEMLWVAPKVNQNLFDAICDMPNLRGLSIKHSSIKHINFKKLSNLVYFNLGSSTQLGNLNGIEQLTNIKWLAFENIKNISDIRELAHLMNLKVLSLNGSTWTTQKLDTLSPIRSLKNLERLRLVNTRVLDKSLEPLHNLPNLKSVDLAQWWPDEQVNALQQANSRLLKNWKEWRDW
ncbi:hypothetical protein [Pseudoalteromonas sp. McH1-42]|uniref:hypothetical protein n=1 Tax=Pseudoalteromonas sp. McH1-42 TaxID=2917752 RepID=UPI001EF5A862|nr:hypothetical protein [Pseudoalteromonas sp. McH1-42]MCG7563103.1 hypothetical protein [Pseudoalteromonas sp. McH1-42]